MDLARRLRQSRVRAVDDSAHPAASAVAVSQMGDLSAIHAAPYGTTGIRRCPRRHAPASIHFPTASPQNHSPERRSPQPCQSSSLPAERWQHKAPAKSPFHLAATQVGHSARPSRPSTTLPARHSRVCEPVNSTRSDDLLENHNPHYSIRP